VGSCWNSVSTSHPQRMGKQLWCQTEMVTSPKRKRLLAQSSGFTLVELVLATLISAMVIAIFSVALSLSLRVWERQQNRQPSDIPSLLELLKWQLAQFEPILINVEGKQRAIFQGDEQSLAFATDYSVRAISKGTPVIARYVFTSGTLFYAEMPLDPYHPEPIQKFLQMGTGDTKSWPRFYAMEIGNCSLSYAGGEGDEMASAVDEELGIPSAVIAKCTAPGDSAQFSAAMFVNAPFTKVIVDSNAAKSGLKRTTPQGRRRRL
jgi:hypothetical protein